MTRITIGEVVHEAAEPGIGINVNHFMDGRTWEDRPLAQTIRDMGAHYLRFPGGEKSDLYLWSTPPFETPRPTFARWGGEEIPEAFLRFAATDGRAMIEDVLPFDRFLELCRDADAEPVVVLPYDAIYKPAIPPGHAPTREELLATAEGWVRYAKAATERGLPAVRYWELGNESYMKAYSGWATAGDYANDLALWAERLKVIDPQLMLGANGPNGVKKRGAADPEDADPWWKTVLTQSARAIDFLAIHDYPCWKWGAYDYYLSHEPGFRDAVDEAVACLREYCSSEDADRLFIAITEMNSTDWQGHPEDLGWKHVNTLGHALVLVDMLGVYLTNSDLSFALLWNTRWIKNDTESPPQLWDALAPDNSFNPTGQAMALWKFATGAGPKERLSIHHADAPDTLPVFAISRGSGTGTATPVATSVVLVNKGGKPMEIEIAGLASVASGSGLASLTLHGEGPEATTAALSANAVTVSPDESGLVKITIPEYAATAIRTR